LETTQALRQATATLHPRDDFLTDVTSFAETDCIQQAGFQRNVLLTQLAPECAVSPFDPQHIERVAVDRRCTSGKERSLDGIIPVGRNIQRKTVTANRLAARYQQTDPRNGSCRDTMEWQVNGSTGQFCDQASRLRSIQRQLRVGAPGCVQGHLVIEKDIAAQMPEHRRSLIGTGHDQQRIVQCVDGQQIDDPPDRSCEDGQCPFTRLQSFDVVG
jgi:hypothetical protein